MAAGVPTAGFDMVSHERMGTRMGLLQQRCTGNLLWALILLKAVGAVALMLYALLWEAGNLVNLPDKKIGFYNFCLWNETVSKLQCPDNIHLQMMGISLRGIMLARFCVYSCLVFSMFYIILVVYAKGARETNTWKAIHIIPIVKLVILSGGMGAFLLQTLQWIHLSDLTGGFLALVGTQGLILIQILTATMYLMWDKYIWPRQSSFTEEALTETASSPPLHQLGMPLRQP